MLGEVRVTGTSNQNETYSYDQTGNTLRRVIGGRTQDFTWNTEGNLSSVHDSSTGDSSYVYSPDGSRLIQRDVAGTTLYLPGMELHLAKGAVSPTVTRYYNFGSRTVAMRTATGVTFLAADPHGSAQIAVDGTDNTKISQRRYTPFGAERGGTSGIWPTTMTRGFVGGIKDNTGLINLGAREYDPANGRFISVDPAFDTSDPQSWSGYTYASNNPVTRSDPTGLSWWDDALDDGEDFISGFDNSIMDLPAPLIDPFTGGGYSDWVNNTWPVEGVAGNLGQMTGLVGPLFTGLGEAGDALELPDLLGGGAKTGETVPEAGGKADASEPANPKPDAPESNTPKPDAPKPDAPKPDAPKPDTPKPDAPEPAPKASDPGPSKPEPAPNGKATVHLHPPKDVNDGIGHASIQVEYDGDVLHTHQVAPQGVGGKTLAREWKGDLPEGTRSFEFDLPNGGGALARMEVDLARSQGSNRVGLGAYDFGTNSCVTFCANVLKAGGVPGVPDNSGDVLMWLLDYK
jgi:RHS repeat-associated protein